MVKSHLLQMRGLKLYTGFLFLLPYVASFTDAWIETLGSSFVPIKCSVASFTDAWIETKWKVVTRTVSNVASFTDAWIETRWYYKPNNKE